MKFFLIFFGVLGICLSTLFADKVILTNGNEILGKITKETSSYIIIRLENSRSRIQIPRSQIVEGGVVYSKDKTFVNPEEDVGLDTQLKCTLVLQKENPIYEVGEPIKLRIQIENVHNEPIKILRQTYSRARVIQDQNVLISFLAISDIVQVRDLNKKQVLKPEPIYDQFPNSYRIFTILPNSQYKEPLPPSESQEGADTLETEFDLQMRYLLSPGKYQIRGFYQNSSEKEDAPTGKIYSETVNIEIIPSTGKHQQVPLNQRLLEDLKAVESYYSKKEWERALKLIDELENRYFDIQYLNYWRGKVLTEKGNYEEGQRCFRLSLSQNASYWPAVYELAYAYYKGRRFQDAYQTLIDVPDAQKKNEHYWLLGQICQTGLLNPEQAKDYYSEFKRRGGTHKDFDSRLQQVSSEKNYETFLTNEITEAINYINQEKIPTDFSFRSKVDSFIQGEFKGQMDYLKDLYRTASDLIYRRYLLIR